jgi:hypothetical protein
MRFEPILQCPPANSKALGRSIHAIHTGGGHRCTQSIYSSSPAHLRNHSPRARISGNSPCTARSAASRLLISQHDAPIDWIFDASAQKRWQTLKHIDGQLDVNGDRKSTQSVIGTVMADRDGHLTVTSYVANQGGNNEQRIEENLKQKYDNAWLLHNLKFSPSF